MKVKVNLPNTPTPATPSPTLNCEFLALEILTDSFSTISAHPNNHFYRYRMSLKQILHAKNLIIEMQVIDRSNWFFSWTYDMLISLMSVLIIWSILFLLFPYGSENFIWRVSTWVWGSLDVFIFRLGPYIFFPLNHGWEFELMHSHQCPWFLRYNIFTCVSCWVLASIMLGAFHGALSPGAPFTNMA